MKQIICEDCNSNIQIVKKLFDLIAGMGKEKLEWTISNFESIPMDCGDYSSIGKDVDNSRQRVYLFHQRVLREYAVILEHRELMNLLDDIKTIYEGIFVVTIAGSQSKISIFDGDIIEIEGDVENEIIEFSV